MSDLFFFCIEKKSKFFATFYKIGMEKTVSKIYFHYFIFIFSLLLPKQFYKIPIICNNILELVHTIFCVSCSTTSVFTISLTEIHCSALDFFHKKNAIWLIAECVSVLILSITKVVLILNITKVVVELYILIGSVLRVQMNYIE